MHFVPLDSTSEESISDLLLRIDLSIQYGEDMDVRNTDTVSNWSHYDHNVFYVTKVFPIECK